MTRRLHIFIIIVLVCVICGPLLYHHRPLYLFTPDVQYVKAKVLRVMAGDLFGDPVSGFPTFHPPYYHVILAGLALIGIPVNASLFFITLSNVVLILLFSFLIIRLIFNERIALWSLPIIPLVFHIMGPGQILLPTAFYFSLPIYMAGLWLYLKPERVAGLEISAGVLWGVAFLISPVYVFLIGFTLAYELVWARRIRRTMLLALPIALLLIPFIYHAVYIYQFGMAETATFAIWRGFPGAERISEFFTYLLSPVDNTILSWQTVVVILIAAAGILGMRKAKSKHAMVYIAGLAYLFTAYHFNSHYATRIQFILSLFLLAYAVQFILGLSLKKVARHSILIGLVALSIVFQIHINIDNYTQMNKGAEDFIRVGKGLKNNLKRFVSPNDFIVVTSRTYRTFILDNVAVHALLAYKTGEYFQLNSQLADEMLRDYDHLVQATSIDQIDAICRKYNMTVAVAGVVSEAGAPLFTEIAKHWETVYSDPYFIIFRKPAQQTETESDDEK